MSLRAPVTPRASNIAQPGSTSGAITRRKSLLPMHGTFGHSQEPSPSDLDTFKEALRNKDPKLFESEQRSVSPSPRIDTYKSLGMRKPSMLGFGISTNSRQINDSPTKNSPALPDGDELEVGDEIVFEAAGLAMSGTLRFKGQVQGKDGQWAGVELSSEWVGKGKNDGSVKGVQYFACPPACGLFIPLAKVFRKTREDHLGASSPTTSIASLPRADQNPVPRIPRSSISPQKPGRIPSTPARGTKVSPFSTVSTTPKVQSRTRASLGSTTPRAKGFPTPRKSLAPSHSASSIRRPSSAMGKSTTPSVPPLPSGSTTLRRLSMASGSHSTNGSVSERCVTPSITSGRLSRTSMLTDSDFGGRNSALGMMRSQTPNSMIARPTSALGRTTHTPSRSISRQSEAVSRASHDIQAITTELKESQEREAQIRTLLSASEAVGRDAEERILAMEHQLKSSNESLEGLRFSLDAEKQKREQLQQSLTLLESEYAALLEREKQSLEIDAKDESEAVTVLKKQLSDIGEREAGIKVALDKLTRESDNKFAAKEGEIESLRERLQEAIEEKQELSAEVDKLRNAGQALCATYEERISEIEAHRLDLLEQVERHHEESATQHNQDSVSSLSSLSRSTRLSMSLASSHTSAADIINTEAAFAEVDHLRTKVLALEEQLEEARAHLEVELNDTKRRKQKHSEMEAALKKEVKTLKSTIEQSLKTEDKLTTKIEELEVALHEAHTALDNARNEIEVLRGETPAVSESASLEMVKLREERDNARKELNHQLTLVAQLQVQLDKHKESISESQNTVPSLLSPHLDPSEFHNDRFMDPRRDSVQSIGSGSRKSLNLKDEVSTMKDQIVGLKVIVSQLTTENQTLSEKNKTLMESTMSKGTGDSVERFPEASLAHQQEVAELKEKLQQLEARSGKEMNALKSEIADLEALVETKVYREEELENELKKLKSAKHGTSANGTEECEMCGDNDHSIEDCPVFGGTSDKDGPITTEWCEECEEHGHNAHAHEVF